MAASADDGKVMPFEKRAMWRFIATHVVLTSEIDPHYREAAGTLGAIDEELAMVSDDHRRRFLLVQAEHAEDRVDVELKRLLEAHRLADAVDEIQVIVATQDPAEAAR
jgi:hypothetical protein